MQADVITHPGIAGIHVAYRINVDPKILIRIKIYRIIVDVVVFMINA